MAKSPRIRSKKSGIPRKRRIRTDERTELLDPTAKGRAFLTNEGLPGSILKTLAKSKLPKTSQDTKTCGTYPIEAFPEAAQTEILKSDISQIPYVPLVRIGLIFVEGEGKYGRNNWRKGVGDIPYQRERLNHALHHLLKYSDGDTTEDHLAKVAWYCVTQMELEGNS